VFDKDIATVWDPSLLATPSAADLLHRKPTCAETSRCNCCAQGSNKRNTLYVEVAKICRSWLYSACPCLSVRLAVSVFEKTGDKSPVTLFSNVKNVDCNYQLFL